MISGRITSLVQASLRKHRRRLMPTKPWLKWYMMDLTHGRGHLRMTLRTSVVFCPRVTQLSMATRGNNASTSCTMLTPTPRSPSTSTINPNQLTVTGNRDTLTFNPSSQATQFYFTSRESVQLSRQLETNYIGPLDSTGGTRLSI